MTFSELASLIAKKEGKKVEVSIGNIREILKIISIELYKNFDVYICLMRNGKKHAKSRKRLKGEN